jgi:hypothetical protein
MGSTNWFRSPEIVLHRADRLRCNASRKPRGINDRKKELPSADSDLSAARFWFQFCFLSPDAQSSQSRCRGRPLCFGHHVVSYAGRDHHAQAQRMGLHASPVTSTALYILLAGSFGLAKSLASALGRGDWLAGISGPRAIPECRLYRHSSDQRCGVGLLALSASDLGRLQQRNAHLVWPDVFHGFGSFAFLYIRLDEVEIGESVDRSAASC